MGGSCRCEEGWTGEACDQRVCSPLCVKHGTCKDGKCECNQGWNGEHCTIGRSMARASLFSSTHSHSLLVSRSFKARGCWEGSIDQLQNSFYSWQLQSMHLSDAALHLNKMSLAAPWQGHCKKILSRSETANHWFKVVHWVFRLCWVFHCILYRIRTVGDPCRTRTLIKLKGIIH